MEVPTLFDEIPVAFVCATCKDTGRVFDERLGEDRRCVCRTQKAGEAVPRARTTDPGTSHAAAASVDREAMRATQRALLSLFEEKGPMTDEQAAAEYESVYANRGWPQQSPSGLRTRRNELVSSEALRDTGEKRALSTGRKAIVWAAA